MESDPPDAARTTPGPRYLPYTRWRMEVRNITEADVEYVLEHYDSRRPAPPYRQAVRPSEIFIGAVRGRRLKVYVERGSNPPLIKTAVWEGD